MIQPLAQAAPKIWWLAGLGATGNKLLVPLGHAKQHARGFHNSKSLEVMQCYFDAEELQMLQNQLYPNAEAAFEVKRLQPIRADHAQQLDPHASAFLHSLEPVFVENARGNGVGYRVPIPVHSDF